MTRTFDAIRALSGQRNAIVIPRAYIAYFKSDQQVYTLAAILNQLVFWSGNTSLDDGWFYKSHEELSEEISEGALSVDHIRRAVDKITKKFLPGIIETANRKVNGTPKKHYRVVDSDALIARLFPPMLDSAKVRNGKRESAKSYLYTDLNKQIIKTPCQVSAKPDDANPVLVSGSSSVPEDPEITITDTAKQVLAHLNMVAGRKYQVGKSSLEHIRARLREHFALEELIGVVDYLTAKWLNDPDMVEYLRPMTIFDPKKFQGYLDGANLWAARGRPVRIGSEWLTADGKPLAGSSAERDEAFRRLVCNPGKPRNRVEELAKTAASTQGLGRMDEIIGRSKWKTIWKEASVKAAGGEEAA